MHFDVWYERPAATEECHGGMCVDVDRILGKSWWPDVCHLSQGPHTLHVESRGSKVLNLKSHWRKFRDFKNISAR